MLDTEREAKRLMSDPGSYSQGSIKHRAFRQMPLRPEEEIPKGRMRRHKKEKHVHKWGKWIKEGETTRRAWIRGESGNYKRGSEYTVVKWVRTCKKCGHRDNGESMLSGPVKSSRGRYWYW